MRFTDHWLTLLAFAAFVLFLVLGLLTPKDDSDPPGRGERSGMGVHTDALTGCQFLSHRNGGLIERRNGRGEHLGCRP